MKRLMFTMMAVGLLMACGGGSTDTMRRLQQAEDVVEEHPDSAAMLLSQVVTTGMTEEETALYGLLWTMAEFKKHNKDVNDSLVSRSIDYFDHYGDKRHRASTTKPSPLPSTSSAPPSAACDQGSKGGRGKYTVNGTKKPSAMFGVRV